MTNQESNAEAPLNRSVNDFESESALREALMEAVDPASVGDGDGIPIFRCFGPPASSACEAGPSPLFSDQTAFDWVLTNYDPETTAVQSMKEELHRLLVLKSYLLLDSNEHRETFERLTALGQRIFRAPVCLVSLVDLGRQWFVSNRGLPEDCHETPRNLAFCAHAIQLKGKQTLVVPDALQDWRFKDHPGVIGEPFVRFYAGAPLIAPEGYRLGTFCIVDYQPRPDGLSADEEASLLDLAAMTVKAMVDRRSQMESREDPARLIAYTAHDLITPLTGVQLSLSLLTEDEQVRQRLDAHQMDLLATATTCSDLMIRICETAIDSLRNHQQVRPSHRRRDVPSNNKPSDSGVGDGSYNQACSSDPSPAQVTYVVDLVKSLQMIMEPIPKKVPFIISLDPAVPSAMVSDDLKLFRSALNLVTNAIERTMTGKVHLRIYASDKVQDSLRCQGRNCASGPSTRQSVAQTQQQQRTLVFECEDTGPDILPEEYPYLFQPSSTEESSLRLGLSSIASLVRSQDGDYGFRPKARQIGNDTTGSNREKSNNVDQADCHSVRPIEGSIFWFSVPLIAVQDDDCGTGGPLSPCKSGPSRMPLQKKRANFPHVPALLRTSTSSSSLIGYLRAESSATTEVKVRSTMDTNEASCERKEEENRINAIPVAKLAENAVCNGHRKKRALVIEDSTVVRKSLVRALDKLGFQVEQAVNGLEGLERLKETLFDMVLCDFLMPGMDGLDCVKQYRAWEVHNRPHFRQYIVGISAHVSTEDSGQGIEAGMDDFRPKPISIKTLTELQLSAVVDGRTKQLDEIEGKSSTPSEQVSEPVKKEPIPRIPCQVKIENHAKVQSINPVSTMVTTKDHPNTVYAKLPGQSRRNSLDAISASHSPFCLVVMDSSSLAVTDELAKVLEVNGWKVVTVNDGNDALRLLKMRNWDVVLVDEDIRLLPAIRCIAEFREWEACNRVNEQRSVFLVCDGDIPDPCDTHSVVQPPFGFNGVIRKPVVWNQLNYLIGQRSSNLNILVRKQNGTACC